MKQKLLIFSILFFGSYCAAQAQPAAGQFYMGGNFSYSYNTYGSMTTYNYTEGYTNYYLTNVGAFSISPEFGYFLSDKFSIGIQPTYQRNSGTETSYYYSYTTPTDNYVYSDKYKSNIAGLGINLRYYAMITDKFGFFPQFNISTLNNAVYLKNGTFSLGATPNFVFFPSQQIGLTLGFGNLSYDLDYATKNHTITAGLNNNITFGLNYYW